MELSDIDLRDSEKFVAGVPHDWFAFLRKEAPVWWHEDDESIKGGFWVVTRYDGEPQGLDGQALRWCSQDELAEVDLLPADKPIVRALRLPERI